ncbi:MAG: 2-oxoacid:acceptor oxidoreductase subunit alpha [Candidatus Poribacteria bacterium]|nr:2-oxoacid:acceptor oxidoreductase subunit alpha [Candidatus Poribacteria bacterium]
MAKSTVELQEAVIRFADDSGTGMQVSGDQFANTSALFGNDLSTLPDFPAEIRAPAGTLAGVSSFQVRFSSTDIHTPGDHVDLLIAMNPAALKNNLKLVKPNGIILTNEPSFNNAKNLRLAGYDQNPLQTSELDKYQVVKVDMIDLTNRALEEFTELSKKDKDRAKNMFALGMVFWLFNRPLEHTVKWIQTYFDRPNRRQYIEPNIAALKAGYVYAEATELFATSYEVKPATLQPGKYRNINGNTGLVFGLLAASQKSGLPLFYSGYPITPASAILHELASYKRFGARAFQAEDEIAAMCAAIGAAYGGSLAVTASSGPGIALKQEALGLAISVELPVIVCNIQRGGPSTGLPTKTEQSDLFQAVGGRHGESPLPVLATSRPSDCFDTIYEAARVAIKYMTPVLLLSDGYLGTGTEPWTVPDLNSLPDIQPQFATDPEGFEPYMRDPVTLARPWAVPGTPGLEHRIGGLEKEDITGIVSYDSENHQKMTLYRAEKVQRVAQDIPPTETVGDSSGELLILGWGSSYGSIRAATEQLRAEGRSVSSVHLRWLNPLPNDLGDVLKRFKRVLIPEMNLGQLRQYIRAEYLIDAEGLNKVQGLPIFASEIVSKAESMLNEKKRGASTIK